MESVNIRQLIQGFSVAIFLFLLWKILYNCYLLPSLAYAKLTKHGFGGPVPCFPFGNLKDMKMEKKNSTREIITIHSSSSSSYSPGVGIITHDIHSLVSPYFARWQKLYGKVFIYWLGTEPFLYIANPELLKQISATVMGKSWGKPTVFKEDREPLFGKGLNMVEGDDWVRHRHIITPAFTPSALKGMTSLMVESARKTVDRWTTMTECGCVEINVQGEITSMTAEIIGKASFGITYEEGKHVFEKLRAMHATLFKSTRYVGVPFGNLLSPRKTMEAKKLGKEIDDLLIAIIEDQRKRSPSGRDLLSLLLTENEEMMGKTALTSKELVDECKTFFFGGYETITLALTWTLLVLALHPEWQRELKEEIKEVIGDGDCCEVDATKLAELKKMGLVMSEVLRLYPPSPNAQRQARADIRVDSIVVPRGTNMWVDIVSMHHDKELWGEDANEFKPERFQDDMNGGCKGKAGFLPFGFGGRMCIGRNLATMEYKIVLTLILARFSFSVSPNYKHSPSIMFSLRPAHGLPLLVSTLQN
ncbi:unnamed protein product [Cuscuta campestris]|uniref:Cytokinin hydroxylase n=1 Tax=Cuscuta campestris TaxID=132261 RepID=A0A484LMA0_9ASTE|nr:unnamed protein product [Cuscuta campestris]